MIRIQLPREEWEYDPDSPLGEAGGFGTVFGGKGKKNEPVAVKKLRDVRVDKAHRELRIADELVGRSLQHVIPVLDSGKDKESGSYFVVMARAEKSLQQEIDRVGVFTDKEAVHVLLDIARGLAEVQEIVHRDLKPANILFHKGRWKVADLGIARFVEESTSLKTLKDFLSPPYAAPEQWRLERATSATDIYALGCIAYALLTGEPPFEGPGRADYRDQHLHKEPPPFEEGHSRLRTLLAMMLRKAPQGRPNLDRVIRLLSNIINEEKKANRGKGFDALAQAGAIDAEAALRRDAAQREYQDEQHKRAQLAESAFQDLNTVINTLFEKIIEEAPTAERADNQFEMPRFLQLGTASIKIGLVNGGRSIPDDAFQDSGWDVVAGAKIQVTQSEPKSYVWGANLWYTDLGRKNEYRWWEIPYKNSGNVRRSACAPYQPFALDDLSKADQAAAPRMSTITLAADPRPVDDEDIDDFCDRWANLLAKAYNGQLSHPRHQ